MLAIFKNVEALKGMNGSGRETMSCEEPPSSTDICLNSIQIQIHRVYYISESKSEDGYSKDTQRNRNRLGWGRNYQLRHFSF